MDYSELLQQMLSGGPPRSAAKRDYAASLTGSSPENTRFVDQLVQSPFAPPPVAFMNAGAYVPTGRLSSGPSPNIEDRSLEAPYARPELDEIELNVKRLENEARGRKEYAASPQAKQLLGPDALDRIHLNRLVDLAAEPVSLPRPRPKELRRRK